MTRKVIGIGETVLDIIFKGQQPVAAVPGGSTFNAIVSLARSGADCTFITETGDDRIGDMVTRFLRDNAVSTDHIRLETGMRSPVSLAFLDDKGDADYLFYHVGTPDRYGITYPDIQRDDIVLISSFYAVNPTVRPLVTGLLDLARERGAIIYYDVNFRPAHRDHVMRITPNLIENLEYADIVRGSREDFQLLYKIDDADHVYDAEVSFYCKKFIYTCGEQPVVLRGDGGLRRTYDATLSHVVSTIGAGDSFNAGIIYGLLYEGVTRNDIDRGLSPTQWDTIVKSGQAFATDCCHDIYNYVSTDFGREQAHLLHERLEANAADGSTDSPSLATDPHP